MSLNTAPTITVTSPAQWRAWLTANHLQKTGVWVAYPKKSAKLPTLSWTELVKEALCYGWIDSLPKKIDEIYTTHYVSPRKPQSVWSALNKRYAAELIARDKMQPAGYAAIAAAKANGSWTWIDEIEAEIIPADLANYFQTRPEVETYYRTLTPGKRKQFLYRLKEAKTTPTRQKRMRELKDFDKADKTK